ncbi:glutamate--cysteine ligase [Georgenia satyanarayanai]|uniref:carboxylate-amine ligase n=1 Tax=Georgenia satyanarayanai TaxID=860221 RepID=UPI00203D03F9|nr:glutamate--cysteine ligase [Georgenia satyanarayanai]MCM3659948.1 glutamate--cysteine ligase [Georgenia satyanarayanai]
MRTVGVEEELLLVRSGTGQAVSLAQQVLRRADVIGDADPDGPGPTGAPGAAGSSLDGELQRQQVETGTAPHRHLLALHEELGSWRAHAESAARRVGARAVALGTSPLPVETLAAPDERYRRIVDHFGRLGSEQLVCGCHVHVAVESPGEAVAVLDRVRVWLPTLLAVSANSPYWQGEDSGYASYRAQVMGRWPAAGPPDLFGSHRAYRERVEAMLATGVVLDEGMVYLDARPSRTYPTLEFRAADVCQDPRDAVVVAALCRALVQTAAEEWDAGKAAPPVPTQMLRLATWQASRFGMSGELLDPGTSRPLPAADVVGALVDHVRPALREADDDLALVEEGVARLREVGTGADRQRRELERTGSLGDVVAAAVRTTHGLDGEGHDFTVAGIGVAHGSGR